jgi:hypothetical protein
MNNKTKKRVKAFLKEKGCVVPFYGKKSKCVLHIIPDDVKCESIQFNQG